MRVLARSADWRSVVDGVRPQVQEIWRGWTDQERERFLRHARPWWDVHRHRMAPAVAAQIHGLIDRGVLTVSSGRIIRIARDDQGLVMDWRAKGQGAYQTVQTRLVINCMGAAGQLARASDPLIADLARQGLIRPDRQDLGLDVDALGRLISAEGRASPTLYCIGPVTRGAFWEITSVPDIRVQAAALARHMSRQLKAISADPWPPASRGASDAQFHPGVNTPSTAREVLI